jgi:hypothetical protein
MVHGESLWQLFILGVHETLMYSLVKVLLLTQASPWAFIFPRRGFPIYE